MMRMGDGSYQPVSRPSLASQTHNQKFLVVLQYYEGDREAAEELGALIADLERVRNKDADILILRRHDANEFDRGIRTKLEDRFEKVFFETCRRRDATGYPFAPNQMWSDIVTLVGQVPQWRDKYYAFIPMESDCTPLHPGWIGELIEEFRNARAHNYAAVGHIHASPVEHLNGVAVYDTNIWRIVGGNKLNGSDPQVAYDIYHRNSILPLAFNTPRIMMEFQRPTITAEDLFRPWKEGIEPSMFHGVKDGSARAAVRAKHIAFSETRDISKRTVFTYEHQRPNNSATSTKYQLWYEAWKSRGWNPVKLSLRDAIRSPKYAAVKEVIDKLKVGSTQPDMVERLTRWVALDSIGGGFMVDSEVLPNNFSPEHLKATSATFETTDAFGILGASLDRKSLAEFLEKLRTFLVNSEIRLAAPELDILKTCDGIGTVDTKIAVYGELNWRMAPLVCFSQSEMQRVGAQGNTLQQMERFLRET